MYVKFAFKGNIKMNKKSIDSLKIAVVIPALNEESAIGNVIRSIPSGIKILVVDNGSEDKTAEIARQNGATVIYEPNRGYGRAIRTGFNYALKSNDIIVMIDGDDTYDPREILKIIKPIISGEKDVIVGCRIKSRQPGMSFMRYIGNKLLSWEFRLLFGLPVTDALSGFKAFSREALLKMELKENGMSFSVEVLIEAARKGLRVGEVPILYRRRKGKSKLNSIKDGFRYMTFMVSQYLLTLKLRRLANAHSDSH
jgi:glycosyltransferase involved in cell wall biosynthesis